MTYFYINIFPLVMLALFGVGYSRAVESEAQLMPEDLKIFVDKRNNKPTEITTPKNLQTKSDDSKLLNRYQAILGSGNPWTGPIPDLLIVIRAKIIMAKNKTSSESSNCMENCQQKTTQSTVTSFPSDFMSKNKKFHSNFVRIGKAVNESKYSKNPNSEGEIEVDETNASNGQSSNHSENQIFDFYGSKPNISSEIEPAYSLLTNKTKIRAASLSQEGNLKRLQNSRISLKNVAKQIKVKARFTNSKLQTNAEDLKSTRSRSNPVEDELKQIPSMSRSVHVVSTAKPRNIKAKEPKKPKSTVMPYRKWMEFIRKRVPNLRIGKLPAALFLRQPNLRTMQTQRLKSKAQRGNYSFIGNGKTLKNLPRYG